MNGCVIRRSALGRPPRSARAARSASRSARRKAVRVPSRPGLRKCMIDHSSSSRFSTGVPVSATRCPAVTCAGGLGGVGERVLDLLRLVEHEHAPLALGQQPAVARQQGVRGQHDVPAARGPRRRACGRGRDGCGPSRSGANRCSSRCQLPEHRRRAHDQRRLARRRRRGRAGRRSAGPSCRGPCRRPGARPGRARASACSHPSPTFWYGRSSPWNAAGRLERARVAPGSRSRVDQLLELAGRVARPRPPFRAPRSARPAPLRARSSPASTSRGARSRPGPWRERARGP